MLRPHSIGSAPEDFPTFEQLNQFDCLELEFWQPRYKLDGRLTGYGCTVREWLASGPGKIWIASYKKSFGKVPEVVKAAARSVS